MATELEKKLIEVKAIAYDLISNMEFLQKKLDETNNQVRQIAGKVNKEREETKKKAEIELKKKEKKGVKNA